MTKPGKPTSDLSEFFDNQTSKGPRCTVGILLNEMEPERADKLRRAMALSRDELHHATIARTLKGWGYTINQSTIGRHRLGDCQCQT